MVSPFFSFRVVRDEPVGRVCGHCVFVYGAIILLCHIRKVFSGSREQTPSAGVSRVPILQTIIIFSFLHLPKLIKSTLRIR